MTAAYHSHADLGGQPCTAPIVPEPEGEVFHAEWEARALALTLAMGATGSWNIDMSRAARETLGDYARRSYYQVWFAGLEKLVLEHGQVLPDELAAGRMLHPPVALKRVLQAKEVAAALTRGAPVERPAPGPARFAVGDRVRTRAGTVPHHTRVPGYTRGKVGTVERLHGAHVFPDANAQGLGEQPQWLYTVVFEAATLWGTEGGSHAVSIDAWESYLEAAA
jgi:nitrile hydratase subunit beta